MDKDICLVLSSVVWSVHPSWRRSRPGKAFCTQSDSSFLREGFINLLGRRKVHIIEQAMAFGFLSYWKGRESMGGVLSKDMYSACEVSGVLLAYACVHAARCGYAQAYL